MASNPRVRDQNRTDNFDPLERGDRIQENEENLPPSAISKAPTQLALAPGLARYVPPYQRASPSVSQQHGVSNGSRRALRDLDVNGGATYPSMVYRARNSTAFNSTSPENRVPPSVRAGDWNQHKFENSQVSTRSKARQVVPKPQSKASFTPHAREPKTKTIGSKGMFSSTPQATQQFPGRKTADHEVRFQDQNTGDIFFHKQVYSFSGREPTDGETVICKNFEGKTIVQKTRFTITMKRTHQGVIELPIKSRGGKGSKGIDPKNLWEYFTLVAPKKQPHEVVNQSPGNPIIRIFELYREGELGSETSMVHIAEPVVRQVDCPDLRKVGKIDQDDMELLMAAYEGIWRRPKAEDEV